MSALVLDAIAASVATLTRVVDAPQDPLGYGTDIATTPEGDLDEQMADVDASSPEAIAQALLRRFDCPRGALPGEPDYGIDVRSWLNVGATAETPATREAELRSEATKDDRVKDIEPKVTPTEGGTKLLIDVRVTPADPSVDSFSLTFVATSAAIVLEQIRRSA
jgi:hypothetical protein